MTISKIFNTIIVLLLCWISFQFGVMWNHAVEHSQIATQQKLLMQQQDSFLPTKDEFTASDIDTTRTGVDEELLKQATADETPQRDYKFPMYRDAHPPQDLPLRRPRTFMGILSADYRNDLSYRKRHRELFKLWNDPRVCTLPEWHREQRASCELIYTFVLGGGNPNGPTQIVKPGIPVLATKPIPNGVGYDLDNEDVAILNIKENMNEGKSPTFLYFATTIMQQYDGMIDYAMKLDADSLLHLHDYLYFAHRHLPPAPYNTGVYAGALRDKAYWPKHTPEDAVLFESYFGNHYEGVHLYTAGQCYLLSRDLAEFVAEEAPFSKPYQEGHEDHDVSAMAFHSPTPIHLLTISKRQRFWEHPVKGEPRWRRVWSREVARMEGSQFEGRTLRLYTEV